MQISNRFAPTLRVTMSVAIAAGVLVACQKQPNVVQVTQKKTVTAPATPSSTESDTATKSRMGFQQGMPQAAAPTSGLQWEKPDSWTDAGATAMRKANFTLGPNGEAECYVSVLPGGAGGLAANVNRWRKQMGLDPMSADDVKALPTLSMLGGEAVLVDLKGTYTGMGEAGQSNAEMLGALLEKPNEMLFVKMVGPESVVSQEQDTFKTFCKSLSEGGGMAAAGSMPPDHPAVGNMPPGMGSTPKTSLTWKAPEGWQQGPQKPMRSVTFVPSPGSKAECYVAELAGNGGGVLANINRWRSQMGHPPLTAGEVQNLPKVTVMGQKAPMVTIKGTYQGMVGSTHPDYTMYGVVALLPNESIFIKMVGPTKELEPQKQNFISFCESLSKSGGAA